jgi:hypothetical protein
MGGENLLAIGVRQSSNLASPPASLKFVRAHPPVEEFSMPEGFTTENTGNPERDALQIMVFAIGHWSSVMARSAFIGHCAKRFCDLLFVIAQRVLRNQLFGHKLAAVTFCMMREAC